MLVDGTLAAGEREETEKNRLGWGGSSGPYSQPFGQTLALKDLIRGRQRTRSR